MRYFPLICLISKAVTCLSQGKVSLVTVKGAGKLCSPSSICAKIGMQPFLLRAQDESLVLASMRAAGVQRANIGGWNGERIDMVIGTAAGEVNPLDHSNRTDSVLCICGPAAPSCPPPCPPPCPPVCAPVCPAPCPPVCPAPLPECCCPAEEECKPPCIEIRGNVCPPICCRPKKCVPKRRFRPCDSPCVVNYPHKKVYVIDELALMCGPFYRILETKCKPFSRDIIWTISKALPLNIAQFGLPTILKNPRILHQILCEARSKFSKCGCVCLFIDHSNNIYIAVGDDYYKVVPNRPYCPPMPLCPPFGFPRRPFPGFCPPVIPFCPPGPCPPMRVNCSPCAPPVKCGPRWDDCNRPCPPCGPRRDDCNRPCSPCGPRRDDCNRPCPPCFTFCRVPCEHMVQVRKRGLYSVLFSRDLELR